MFRNVSGSFFTLLVLANVSIVLAEESQRRPAVRDVTPPGIIRVYGEPNSAKSNEDQIVNERHFQSVRVLPDGTIRSNDDMIELYGIQLPARDKVCAGRDDARWACGLSAIGALRSLVHGRQVACRLQSSQEATGPCRVGRTDITARLLEQGWATLRDGVTERRYVEAAEYGRTNQLGIWANGPAVNR